MDKILKGSISSQSNFVSDLLSSRYIDTEPNNLFYIKQVSFKISHQATENIKQCALELCS